MTKRVWSLTDRRPCGSADREDKRTIKNVWVMGKMTKKSIEIVTNHTGMTGTNVGCEKNHYQDNREQGCHRSIFFAFFGVFLHSLFSLLIHFYAFSVMFCAYSLRILDLPMTKILI